MDQYTLLPHWSPCQSLGSRRSVGFVETSIRRSRGTCMEKRMRKKPIHMWRLTQKMPETKPKQTTSKQWICKRGNFNDQVIQAVTFLVSSWRSRLQPLSSGNVTLSLTIPNLVGHVALNHLVCGVSTKKKCQL